MRIFFAGTPDFACPSLEALAASSHDVVGVLTQPDRARGRGRQLRASPVKRLARTLALPVHQPATLQESAVRMLLEQTGAELMVVVAYGMILPRAILGAPARGCINVHASLLPRWRGAAPIQRAILAGDRESGVTIMRMNEGLDSGDILLQRRCAITPETTGGGLHDRLARMGRDALASVLQGLEAGSIVPRPQNEKAATYARKLTKREARLDWGTTARELARKVRAFNPWPMTYAMLDGEVIRIRCAAVLDEAAAGPPGSVLRAGAGGIDIATGEGVLRVETLQWPGGRFLTAREAVNGHRLNARRFT